MGLDCHWGTEECSGGPVPRVAGGDEARVAGWCAGANDSPGRVAVATDESAGGAGLRFDLRVHGVSGGQESELKIVWSANNIRAACDHPRVRRYVAGTDTCQFTERDANGELAPGVCCPAEEADGEGVCVFDVDLGRRGATG